MKIFSGLLVFILADIVLATTSETKVVEDNPTHSGVEGSAFTEGYGYKKKKETTFSSIEHKQSVTTSVVEDNPSHSGVEGSAFTRGYGDKKEKETTFPSSEHKQSVTTSDDQCEGLVSEECAEKSKKFFEDMCANNNEICKNYKILQQFYKFDEPLSTEEIHPYIEKSALIGSYGDGEIKAASFALNDNSQGTFTHNRKSGKNLPEIKGFTPLHNCSLNGSCVSDDTLKKPFNKNECKVGFTKNSNGTNCTDIDECLNSVRPCHQYANCTNTVGSYICTCWDGFKDGNIETGKQLGQKCTEINECNEENSCSEFATCKNNVGSYTCECWDGYTDKDPGQPGTNCELVQRFSLDVECGELTHAECIAKATKMFENYCATNDDERCKNYKILDFDECAVGDKCPDGARCLNTPGGYTCECDEGSKYVEASHQCNKEVCYLGMKYGGIADEQISTSSDYDHQHFGHFARLDNQKDKFGAWSAGKNKTGEWIQIDLGKPTSISGIITQGKPTRGSKWVTKYKVHCGMEISTLAYVDDGKEFIANKDMDSHVYNMFSKSIVCRYLRINPTAWHNYISMRIELVKGECGKPF